MPAPTLSITLKSYEREALAKGFDEVAVRTWPPLAEAHEHRHDFSVEALVVDGEMWLTEGDATRRLQPGDTFTLDAGVPHSERYGAEGATYWAARKTHVPG